MPKNIYILPNNCEPCRTGCETNSCIKNSIPVTDENCNIYAVIPPGQTGNVLKMVRDENCGMPVPRFVPNDPVGDINAGDIRNFSDEVFKSLTEGDKFITTSMLADGAVTTIKIADNAITSDKINDGAITEEKIQAGAVTLNKLDDNSVDSSKIVDGSIQTSDIADSTITLDKLANNSVDSSKIVDGSIQTSDLSNGAVTSSKLSDNAVTNSKIANGAVTNEKISGPIDGSKIDFSNVGSDFCTAVSECDTSTSNYYTAEYNINRRIDLPINVSRFENVNIGNFSLNSNSEVGDNLLVQYEIEISHIPGNNDLQGLAFFISINGRNYTEYLSFERNTVNSLVSLANSFSSSIGNYIFRKTIITKQNTPSPLLNISLYLFRNVANNGFIEIKSIKIDTIKL